MTILDTGVIDSRDAAFAQAVQLPDGDILCSYGVGGGAIATGWTDWSRSKDGGHTWQLEGTIMPSPPDQPLANFLKLSRSPRTGTIFAYGATLLRKHQGFGNRDARPALCVSHDQGKSWSANQPVPMPPPAPYEVSHGILTLADTGRLLAPAATTAPGKLGETVYAAISDDDGKTWPSHAAVMRDPKGELGFFEQKLTQLPDSRVLCTCWTVTMGKVTDRCNHFALSEDQGQTWTPPQSTEVMGQTMSAAPLDERHLLVLYNRRFGRQGVVMQIIDFSRSSWDVRWESMLYDPGTMQERASQQDGLKELDIFAFGFPTLLKLASGQMLATWWAAPAGKSQICWALLAANPAK